MQTDSSGRKIGSLSLSLKSHIELSRGTWKMVASHPADEIGGEAFAGGADGTFLEGKGLLVCPRNQSLIVGFGGLFL